MTAPRGRRHLTAVRSGEAEWGEKLPAYQALLLRTARRLAHDEAEAKDLVQEVYVRALSHAKPLRAESDLRTWLVSILVHRFIDLCRLRRTRGQSRGVHELEERLPAPEPQPTPRWALVDDQTLAAVVERLPADMRAVYRLHAVDGLDYAQIAEVLKIPRSTVGTRLLRARRRLREMLEETLP